MLNVSGCLRRNFCKSVRKLFSVVHIFEHNELVLRKFISQLGIVMNSVGGPWSTWEGDITNISWKQGVMMYRNQSSGRLL
jgi:hypothetical protein